jgi:hypothetical protein
MKGVLGGNQLQSMAIQGVGEGPNGMRTRHRLVAVQYVVAFAREHKEGLLGDRSALAVQSAQLRVHPVDADAVADGDGQIVQRPAARVESVLRVELYRPCVVAAAAEDLGGSLPDTKPHKQLGQVPGEGCLHGGPGTRWCSGYTQGADGALGEHAYMRPSLLMTPPTQPQSKKGELKMKPLKSASPCTIR